MGTAAKDPIQEMNNGLINPCPAEYIRMPCPLPVFSQSDHLIQIVDINSHT